MSGWFCPHALSRAVQCGGGVCLWLALAGFAPGQTVILPGAPGTMPPAAGKPNCPAPWPSPYAPAPWQVPSAPSPWTPPARPTPTPEQKGPEQKGPEKKGPEKEPDRPTTPPDTPAATPPTDTAAQPGANQAGDTSAAADAFGGLQTSAVGGEGYSGSPGGYLDNPIPITTFRLRYDAGFNLNRPDRASYFYAAWKELGFHPHVVKGGGVFFDAKARGPDRLPSRVDYQEASAYAEFAVNNRFSVFADVPWRYVHFGEDKEEIAEARRADINPVTGSFFPEPGRNIDRESDPFSRNGMSDFHVGFKAALVANPNQYLTFQLRTYIPTGDPNNGLGTGHVSLEPGLLYYQNLTQDLILQAQVQDWIPLGGGPIAGNVLSYGAGLGYNVFRRGNFRVVPITEFLGWTVTDGFESFFGSFPSTTSPALVLPRTHGVQSASGDTIINAKLGVRTYLGNGQDFYVGWGRCLTGERWYQEILRVEYRMLF